METILPKLKPSKWGTIATVALILIAASVLINLGVQWERSRYKDQLPANESCLKALENASLLLQGEEVDVATHVKACKETSDQYEVVRKP